MGRKTPVLCPFRLLTGHRCPLCGLTTSVGLLVHGHPAAALRSHPIGPLAVAICAGWLAVSKPAKESQPWLLR
ncbi:MAG: DUF2752 domain-containing protein [Acidimicrobiales bacterium]